jgi:hypothetical protein
MAERAGDIGFIRLLLDHVAGLVAKTDRAAGAGPRRRISAPSRKGFS